MALEPSSPSHYTLHTENHYDHEIQITKPTDLFYVLMIHLPGGNIFTFLFSHIETIKHAFGLNSIVMKDCIPKKEQPKVRFFARIHMNIMVIYYWLFNIFSNLVTNIIFTFTLSLWNYIY